MDPRNNQEVVDFVVAALRKQNCKASKGGGDCWYRLGDLKCAAGHLIPDCDYRTSFEGQILSTSYQVTNYFKERGFDVDLIRSLQRIHDGEDIKDWEDGFERAAKAFNLVYSYPQKD